MAEERVQRRLAAILVADVVGYSRLIEADDFESVDGADVICNGTPTAGSFGCPSSTCGPATAEAIDRAPAAFTGPVFEEPGLEVPPRMRSWP